MLCIVQEGTASTSTQTKQGGERGEETSPHTGSSGGDLLWTFHYPTGEEDPAVAVTSQEPAEVRDPPISAAWWRAS